MEITVSIKDFLKKFNEEYKFLYDHKDRVAGYSIAVDAFDDFSSRHKEFINEFVKYRGDYITSDREAAAFMFALESLT